MILRCHKKNVKQNVNVINRQKKLLIQERSKINDVSNNFNSNWNDLSVDMVDIIIDHRQSKLYLPFEQEVCFC